MPRISLDNYDLRLALQRGIPYLDAGYPPVASIVARFAVPSPYSSVIVGGYLYVVIAAIPGILRKIDPATGATITDIVVGKDPRGAGYDGQHIFVANYDLNHVGPANTVSIVDPVTDTVVATVVVGPAGSKPVMVEFDGIGHMWVACKGTSNAYRIDCATFAVTSAKLGYVPGALAFDNRAYMHFGGARLGRMRTTTMVPSFGTGDPVTYGMCSGAGFIWGTDFGKRLYRINRLNMAVTPFILPRSPTRRPFFEGKRIWVPCGDSGHTVIFDTETSEVVADLNIGGGSNRWGSANDTHAFISAGDQIVKVTLN